MWAGCLKDLEELLCGDGGCEVLLFSSQQQLRGASCAGWVLLACGMGVPSSCLGNLNCACHT